MHQRQFRVIRVISIFLQTHITVSLDGGADLLRAGCDGELRFALQAFIQSLLGHGGGAAHVLVAGVGAAANEPCGSGEELSMAVIKIKRIVCCWAAPSVQEKSVLTNFHLQRPAVLLSSGADIRHWVRQVRGEGSVDVGLQLHNTKATNEDKRVSQCPINKTISF